MEILEKLTEKKNLGIKSIVFFLICLISVQFISSGLIVGQAETNYSDSISPKIIILGNQDEPVQTAILEISKEYQDIRIINYDKYEDMGKNIPIYSKYIFWIGHGEENGLWVDNSLVSWNTIVGLTSSFKGSHQFFLACYSNSISSEKITTFSGNVDARIAAKVSVIKAKLFDLDTKQDKEKGQKSVIEKVNELISCTTALSKGKIKSLSLGTESGYEFAIQRARIVKRSFWGIPYDWEEAIYVNMCPWVIDAVLAVSGVILAAIAAKLGAAVYAAIGLVLGMTAAVWAVIFGVLFAIALVSLKWNQYHRGGHDAKIGFSFRSVPIPFAFLRYDNSYKESGGDFIVPMPQLAPYGIPGCIALSAMPNNRWIGVNFPY